MMTDICPACGYYLYDGECQGCGSVFTEEALKAISKLAADIDQYPTPQEHVALTNAGWFQHSREIGEPYPHYYKNGSRYLHVLQYKPVGENSWHLSHTYKGGRGASPEGPPLPEPTSHSKLVGEMGENTVGERMKNINVDRQTNPIYDPFIPETTPLFQRTNANPGLYRFAESTQTEDLIYDGPPQKPNWFGAPEYKTRRADITEDESSFVERPRDADVSVENGVPGRLAVAPIGDHVHAHCPKGHSKATRINIGAYRCDVCGAQWRSKNSKAKGNQADGLNLGEEGLRPGNWRRVHHDEDEGLEEGWLGQEELPPIESSWRRVSVEPRKWRPGELRPEDIDSVIDETLRSRRHPEDPGNWIHFPEPTPYSYDWEEGPHYPLYPGLPDQQGREVGPYDDGWESTPEHIELRNQGFDFDGEEYHKSHPSPTGEPDGTRAFRHTLTPHPDGSWEHCFEINPPGDVTSHIYFGHHENFASALSAVHEFNLDANRVRSTPWTLSNDPRTLRRFFDRVPGEYGAEAI